MSATSLYLASPCYGGLAHARYARALLALRAACAQRGIALQLDLGGGEALISRARAGMMAKFLASEATHLLFIDGDVGFDPADVFRLLDGSEPVANLADDLLLISREAAQQVTDAYPDLRANLGDVRGAGITSAVMVFESIIDPDTGGYLADLAAFTRRWQGAARRDS
jgi:hypothetical protein